MKKTLTILAATATLMVVPAAAQAACSVQINASDAATLATVAQKIGTSCTITSASTASPAASPVMQSSALAQNKGTHASKHSTPWWEVIGALIIGIMFLCFLAAMIA